MPDRVGHDDVVLAASFALLPLVGGEFVPVVERIVTQEDLEPELADWSIAPYDDGWSW